MPRLNLGSDGKTGKLENERGHWNFLCRSEIQKANDSTIKRK